MEFLWKHVFDLVDKLWELNQNDIANYWDVNRSTISNLKNGKQLQFKPACSKLYRDLFDPTNPKSPVSGKEPMVLLRDLKKEIEDAGLTDLTKGIKDDDYENFVVSLLRLAKENQSKLSTKNGIVPHNTTENKSNNQKDNETQPERMLDVCRQSFEGFPIEEFIDSNPADSIKSYLIEDAFFVVKCIRQKHDNGDSPDKHNEIYQNIVKFADDLLEYLKFLKSASGNLNILDEGYKPLNGDDNEYVEESNYYRQELRSLYQLIKMEIERQRNEEQERQRASYKEVWEKNTRVGDETF